VATTLAGAQAQSPAPERSRPDDIQYLAFQVFTDSSSPQMGAGGQATPNGPPARAMLDALAVDLITRVGAGDTSRRLALIFGPILFDHSDEQAARLIDDAFDIALARDVAVGFHLDDSMFWRGRRDLVEDPRNVERADWDAPPSTARRLDWGPVPARLAPQMCLNSPAIEAEVRRRGRDVIGAAIARGLERLRAAGRDDLFAGVIVGWETHIGRDFADPGAPLGFCVLSNLGLRPGASPQAMDDARIKAVQRFITLWSQAVADAGVPQTRVYSHIAFTPRRHFDERQAAPGTSYAQSVNFAPIETAFGPSRRGGFSTYPTPGLMEEIREAPPSRDGAPWASAEGANVNLASAVLSRGSQDSGMSMETYLARHFNHGAALVNIFGWGLGEADNPFRRAAEE
jgi:hypothetical protein